ncbi:type IV secretory system conjugative DNA transfer family protein [Mucilaginibacter mali]|uniref:Type IV secretory system conjugative DNA transfer family protein n=1 Tax=Mucilaginibacter mali TaxID=2740462 RepID=A0A7D4QB82_9SPHI|nr:type IV secretory system conjugative DNA transfer family protein [Mucilaginibacter mali]QKJ32471.1 type IV secretory system conjugative DNA transfer family protein [Mucilaginibacter mali]
MKAIQFIIGLIADFFGALADAFHQQDGFNAAFGSERLIGSRLNKGFVYSKSRKLSRKASHSNFLITGITGKGKSTRLIAKSIFTLRNCSMIIHDPSMELYSLASGFLSKFFVVKTLNFSNDAVSSGYNPLSRIRKPGDVSKLAHMLVAILEKGSGDPYWSLASKKLCQIIIRIVLLQPEEHHHICNCVRVLKYFQTEPSKTDTWVARSGDEKLILDYKALIATPERTLQNVVASLSAALEIYDTPSIAKVCSSDTIDFEAIRKTPHVIFLHNSIADQAFLSTLTSVYFEQFFNFILERLPGRGDLDVFCILDEASSLKIPLLPLFLANCRKFRCGNLLAIQGKSQLQSFYGQDATSIVSNCSTRLYLPGISDVDELREIETLSGKCTYRGRDGKQVTRQLVTADEIRQLHDDRTLILSGNHPIIRGRSSFYFRSPLYRRYAAIPPLPMGSDIPGGPIAFL